MKTFLPSFKFAAGILFLALPSSMTTTSMMASAAKANAMGYLIDNQCIKLCKDTAPDKGCAPDGSNVFYNPYDHTGECLLLQVCVDSGYSLVSEYPTNVTSGRHSILLSLAGDASQKAAVSYIQAGTRGPFPKVTVVYDVDVDLATTNNGTGPDVPIQSFNATIVDPWYLAPTTSPWNGADTTLEICYNSTARNDIETFNYCYRSDVIVSRSKQDSKNMIIIESNGCPDHPNMQGSNGTVPNIQQYPGDACGSACGGASTSSTCGVCGSCGCGSGGCGSGSSSNPCCTSSTCHAPDCGGGTCASACADKPSCGAETVAVASATKNNIFSHPSRHRFLNQPSCGTCSSCGASATSCGAKDTTSCSGCSGCGSHSSSGGCDSGGCGCGNCCCGSNPCGNFGCGNCGCGSNQCGCGCGTCECGSSYGTYQPFFQHYTMVIPQDPGRYPGDPTPIKDDVVGILANGVLLDSHKQTWAYDSCNGHSDKKHQYHYHIPPMCFLKGMGIPFADSKTWWLNDEQNATRNFAVMASRFPQTWPGGSGTSMFGLVDPIDTPVIGFARDGFPIFALYDDTGTLQRSKAFGGDLDECNGKMDSKGNYGYYITPDPPFAPTCLRGKRIGLFTYSTSNIACPKEGIKNTINPSLTAAESTVTTTHKEGTNHTNIGTAGNNTNNVTGGGTNEKSQANSICDIWSSAVAVLTLFVFVWW